MHLRDLFLSEALGKTKLRPTKADIARILKMREAIRHDEGAGGQCGFVADWIHRTFGWGAHSGVYTDLNDDPIIDHVWNVLPDGAILDATADQIGEGHDVRIVEPGDPDHRRYRWEWTDDFNPQTDPDEADGREWNGETDVDRMDRLRAERGNHWWLKDRAHIDAYLQKEKGYSINGRVRYMTEGRRERLQIDGKPVMVLINPSARETLAYVEKTEDDRVRGILDGNTLYIWDAYYGTHASVAADLGVMSGHLIEATKDRWGSYTVYHYEEEFEGVGEAEQTFYGSTVMKAAFGDFTVMMGLQR